MKAQLASTWVELVGPPRVRTYTTTVMSVKVRMAPNRAATATTGRVRGMVTSNMRRHQPAPSTLAASSMSLGMATSPARMMTADSGVRRHTWTAITDAMASPGRPSQ
jgi:hypothetical protein